MNVVLSLALLHMFNSVVLYKLPSIVGLLKMVASSLYFKVSFKRIYIKF